MTDIHPLRLLAGLCLLIVLSSCGQNRQGFRHPVLEQIHDQIASSCDQVGARYEKSVQNMGNPDLAPEDSLLVLSDSCRLLADLQHAYEQSFLEPGIRDFFDVTTNGDTTIATIREGREKKVDIRSQKLVFSSVDSTLLYLELHIRKRQFLYDLDADLKLHFDSAGVYQQHVEQVKIHVSGGDTYFGKIEGKLTGS